MNLKALFSKVLEKEESENGLPPGRKFTMGKYVLLLATLGFLVTSLAAPLSANFTIYIGALATLYTIYCGGNVGNKLAEKPTNTNVILDRRKVAVEPKIALSDNPDTKED